MNKFYYKSPFGIIEFIIQNEYLLSLKYTNCQNKENTESKCALNIKKQLDEYFEQKRKSFDIDIILRGTTFQKKVWNALLEIPYGRIKSYGEIAEKIGNKNACRAVGNACNKNPILIIVPCHRVIAKGNKIGGFAYGTKLKENLLKLEMAKAKS